MSTGQQRICFKDHAGKWLVQDSIGACGSAGTWWTQDPEGWTSFSCRAVLEYEARGMITAKPIQWQLAASSSALESWADQLWIDRLLAKRLQLEARRSWGWISNVRWCVFEEQARTKEVLRKTQRDDTDILLAIGLERHWSRKTENDQSGWVCDDECECLVNTDYGEWLVSTRTGHKIVGGWACCFPGLWWSTESGWMVVMKEEAPSDFACDCQSTCRECSDVFSLISLTQLDGGAQKGFLIAVLSHLFRVVGLELPSESCNLIIDYALTY
mmetsp:Transcript_40634/g.80289  ORF Transcript_40634/g.80289 Transcript_40634/m.80289 type:complete len:271 (-) Transcript_40634:207-1019(-)